MVVYYNPKTLKDFDLKHSISHEAFDIRRVSLVKGRINYKSRDENPKF